MNDVITSREELFLAKLAGRDVDIKTMTPPVASSLTEKLMLEIADRLDNMGGGSSETYETVAEIEVGEMVGVDGKYSFTATNVTVPTIDTSATYYLNDSENPSSHVDLIEEDPAILFNVTDPEDFRPEDPSKPLVAFAYDEQKSTCLVMSDTPDLSNTTVKILKKVSAPSGGNDDFIINATLVPEDGTFEISDADAGFADIVSAVNAGKTVKLCASADPAVISLLKVELILSMIIGEGGADSFATFYGAANYDEADDSRILVAIAEPASVGNGLDFTTHMYVPAPYEFHFTVTPGQSESEYTVTPDDPNHDMYSNIREALSATPLVFAVISIPAQNQVVRTLFSVDYTQTGSEFLSALAMFWGGTKFMGARLAVPASGDPSIVFSET